MFRVRFIFATVLIATAAVGCRTPEASKAKSEDLTAAGGGAPGPIVAMVTDDVAETIYNAYHVDEQPDGAGASKSYSGEIWAHCVKSGGGALPPGAQGIVASGTYMCSLTVPMHFPAGAQGLPAPPMAQFSGFAAQKFFEAMQVTPHGLNGAVSKGWNGTGSFTCQYTSGIESESKSYQCTLAGNADSGSGSDDNAFDKTIVALNGTPAQNLYKKLTSITETVTDNGKSKRRDGGLAIDCTRTMGGGSLPPGAQGIIAPTSTACTIVAPASIPAGAQGFPGPAKTLAKLSGADANAFYAAFDVGVKAANGKQTKSFNDEAQFECHYATLQSVKTWACTVMGKGSDGGSGDGGVSGYDISGNKTSCVPSSQTICTQQVTSGDMFKSQCEAGGGHAIFCKCHTYLCSKGPGDDGNGGSDLVALSDEDASGLYDALNIPEKVTSIGGSKTRGGQTAINCTQHSSALPPGTQGIAPNFPATTCTMNATLPPGVLGMVGPTALAKVTGLLANHFYSAFNVDEKTSGNTSTKSFSGKVSINCHYANFDGLKSGWDCRIAKAGSGIPAGAQGLPAPQD